ncbi:outer membrane lipoprotein-sorting protein [Hahella ganghwensis]|uniref:outer membrane lipoprotein-sorting protein n=1 Tax=Hahella ganghwensis TaxID=286420 RepID=UPI00035C4BA9|nr:outer membrane lipoprotein-sorting protein [Hahella ganghwensis]
MSDFFPAKYWRAPKRILLVIGKRLPVAGYDTGSKPTRGTLIMSSYRKAMIGLLFYIVSSIVEAAEAKAVIARMEALLWSDTNQGRFVMTIETPYWSRTLELDVWMQRPDNTFIRVLSPKKERGIGSLRKGSQMWNYIPKIDRIVKIPPSMMLQPWMGSDFSNDDLVKQSSLINDYHHNLVEKAGEEIEHTEADNDRVKGDVLHIVSTPKPDAAVVWGKIESWVHGDTGIPVKQVYFDDAGKAVRELTFGDVQSMDGRLMPTRWQMRPLDEDNKKTVVELKDITFDRPIDAAVFSDRNLRRTDW